MFETVTIYLRRRFGAGIMAAGWVRSLDWTHIVSGVPGARFLQTPDECIGFHATSGRSKSSLTLDQA